MRRLRLVIALLAAAGLVDSAYLTVLKLQLMQQGLACGFGGCDYVNASEYSVLLGVPVALWGAIAYALLLGLSLFWSDATGALERGLGWIVVAVAGWSFSFSAYLTGVELFVLHAICPFCVVSAVLITFILALAVVEVWLSTRADLGSA